MPTVLDISSLKFSKLKFQLHLTNLRPLEDGELIRPGMHIMRIPTPEHGDVRIPWDSNSFAEITEAKQKFDELVLQGLVPYRVGVDGEVLKDELGNPVEMTEFDPFAEEVYFCPIEMVVGG